MFFSNYNTYLYTGNTHSLVLPQTHYLCVAMVLWSIINHKHYTITFIFRATSISRVSTMISMNNIAPADMGFWSKHWNYSWNTGREITVEILVVKSGVRNVQTQCTPKCASGQKWNWPVRLYWSNECKNFCKSVLCSGLLLNIRILWRCCNKPFTLRTELTQRWQATFV